MGQPTQLDEEPFYGRLLGMPWLGATRVDEEPSFPARLQEPGQDLCRRPGRKRTGGTGADQYLGFAEIHAPSQHRPGAVVHRHDGKIAAGQGSGRRQQCIPLWTGRSRHHRRAGSRLPQAVGGDEGGGSGGGPGGGGSGSGQNPVRQIPPAVATGDGMQALQMAGEAHYDLVITDVEMPHLDGFSLTERLRADASYRDVPIIIVTSREKEEDRIRGVSVGANAYIIKGAFDQSNLVDTVKNLIGKGTVV